MRRQSIESLVQILPLVNVFHGHTVDLTHKCSLACDILLQCPTCSRPCFSWFALSHTWHTSQTGLDCGAFPTLYAHLISWLLARHRIVLSFTSKLAVVVLVLACMSISISYVVFVALLTICHKNNIVTALI